MTKKHLIWLLCALMAVTIAAIGCKQAAPTPTPDGTDQNPIITANYVGSNSCKNCHTEAHTGFTQTKHYNTFKPLADYNISDLPKEITIYDTAVKENPPSATLDLSTVSGVMADHYVIAPVPLTAGFQSSVYRVAAVHKEGDKWTLEPAKAGDYNNDGTEDWGAANYTCGNCHSPGLGKSDQEATIGCESCHGPGGTHVQAAEKAGTMTVSQDACIACHESNPAKNDEGVWEATNHYGTRNYFASKHAGSDQTNDCLACHTPHKVNTNGQTVVGDDPVNDNCKKCHTQNFDLESLMWLNPTDPYSHFTRDHSFGAMPYEDYGDDKDTKPLEITNEELVKIIEEKIED